MVQNVGARLLLVSNPNYCWGYLHQVVPAYLTEMCTYVSTSVHWSHLWCAVHGHLAERQDTDKEALLFPTELAVTERLRPSLSLSQFCARLKAILFCRAYQTLSWHFRDSLGCKACCRNINVLTYLLTLRLEASEPRMNWCPCMSVCDVRVCVCPVCIVFWGQMRPTYLFSCCIYDVNFCCRC